MEKKEYECPNEVRAFIEEYDISKSMIAECMGMQRSTFANKYSPSYYKGFTREELKKFKKVMIDIADKMQKSIENWNI